MNNERSIQRSLQELIVRLCIGYVLALFVLLGLAVFFNSVVKHELASQASQLISRMVKRGDYKEPVYTLSGDNLKAFVGIVYETGEGERLFSLPTSLDFAQINRDRFFSRMKTGEIIFPVEYGPNGQVLGRVRYYFDRFSLLPMSFGIWAVFILVTIPLVHSYRRRILADYKGQVNFEKAISKSEVAKKVRHDVRSPLTALQTMVQQAEDIPELRKTTLRSIAGRIESILSDLSEMQTENPNDPVVPILGVLQEVVNESRATLKQREIFIDLKSRNGLIGFAKLNPNRLKTHISNLIQNAIEASSNRISLNIVLEDKFMEIAVADDGCGISNENLNRVGEKGYTQKIKGSGLGVHYAQEFFKSLGGKLWIKSKQGHGTTVMIQIPKENTPAHFVESVRVHIPDRIVAIDDDETILAAWRSKLQGLSLISQLFSATDELQSWFFENSQCEASYFLDLEIKGSELNGLDLAQILDLKGAILLTSYYDDSNTQARCRSLGVRILPKVLMPSLSFNVDIPASVPNHEPLSPTQEAEEMT